MKIFNDKLRMVLKTIIVVTLASELLTVPILAQTINASEVLVAESTVLGCPKGESCFPKCCKHDSIFNLEIMKCSPANDSKYLVAPDIFQMSVNETNYPTLTLLSNGNMTAVDNYGKVMSAVICNGSMGHAPYRSKTKVLSDGRLYVDIGTRVDIYETEFCVDNFADEKKGVSFHTVFMCSPLDPVLTLQSPQNHEPRRTTCSDIFDNAVTCCKRS